MYYFNLVVLFCNLIWFGLAFHLFSLKSSPAAKMFIAREKRIEPYNAIVSRLLKFLGGFNLALFVLSLLAIYNYQTLINNQLADEIFFVFFIAHGTQFWFNLPLAIDERKNQPPIWPVLKGRMYLIFRVDFLLMICNLIFCIHLFLNPLT